MTSSSRIMVIDEEPSRKKIADYLEDAGFIVIEASDGQKALDLVRQSKPHLVLTDLCVSRLNGFQILDLMVKEFPEIPVVMMSKENNVNDVVEALRLGAWDFVACPQVDLVVLEHAVCKALERSRLVVENENYRKELEHTNEVLKDSLMKLEEDQKAGRQVQLQILPNEFYEFTDYRFQHKILPSLYLSGDFVDYFQIDENHLGFYIADVSGHGASSAFVTVYLKSLMTQSLSECRLNLNQTIHKPAELLKKISDELLKIRLGKYLTMFYGIINTKTNTLSYSIGGHYPSPLITDGKQATYLEGSGFAVGIYEHAEFETYTKDLPQQFSLMMFSDGILEILQKQGYADQEIMLQDTLKEMPMSIDQIIKRLQVNTERVLPDDVTLFMVSRI